jgi:hypothetical protein
MLEFTPQVIAGIVGLVLTLLFAYFPVLRVKYGGLQSEVKSAIMLGLLALTALAVTLLANAGVIQTTEPVTWALFAKVLFAALIANQPTYSILPEAADVKDAKALREP